MSHYSMEFFFSCPHFPNFKSTILLSDIVRDDMLIKSNSETKQRISNYRNWPYMQHMQFITSLKFSTEAGMLNFFHTHLIISQEILQTTYNRDILFILRGLFGKFSLLTF